MAQTAAIAPNPFRVELQQFSPALCYALVSVALLGVWVAFYVLKPLGFEEPGRDTWHHVAVLRELMNAPFAPSNPHLPTDEPSRYFTPVAVVAALFGKAVSLSPYHLFGYMGAATCIGLVAACWAFARRYYASPWAPLIFLLALLFGWGAQVGHAGLHTYATLLTSAAYPSTIALVLGLFSWALALRILDASRPEALQVVMLGAISAVMLLVHQLTGVIVLVGTGSLILFHDRTQGGVKAVLLGGLFLGCLSTLAWPYFPILDVISSASDPRWKSAVVAMNDVSTTMMLVAVTFVGVLGFRKSNGGLRWELVVPAALFTVGYIVLTLQDSAIAHRLPAAIALYNQLGIVWLILGFSKRADHPRRLNVALGAAAALFIAAAAIAAGLYIVRARAPEETMIGTAEAIAAHLHPDSVSLATERVVFPLQSTGRRVVSIPRPEPAAPSLVERQIATDQFFSGSTSREERNRLIDRWGATNIVLVAADLEAEVVDELRALGPSKTFSHGAEVISLNQVKTWSQRNHDEQTYAD